MREMEACRPSRVGAALQLHSVSQMNLYPVGDNKDTDSLKTCFPAL